MAIFPKTSARGQGARDFEPGSLVMFENDGVPLLGAIVEFRKDKYRILSERNRSVDMAAERLYSFLSKVPADLAGPQERADYMTTLRTKAEEMVSEKDIRQIWTLVERDGRDYSCLELCRLYFGKPELNNHIGLRFALLKDKIYFKRKKENFSPRLEETIDELQRAEDARQEKIKLQADLCQFFKRRLSNPTIPTPKELLPLVTLIESIAADATGSDERKHRDGKELISELLEFLQIETHGSLPQRAYSLLLRIGHFNSATNLALIRHRPSTRFSEEILAEAESLSLEKIMLDSSSIAERKDLTDIAALTIDDDRTLDMDDALSIERIANGYRLMIHISDVAALVRFSSELDKEALLRATSLYLPDMTVNMLPEILSQDRLSLLLNEKRLAVTYSFNIDTAFNPTSFEIVPSLIKVSRRLNYDQANDLLESGDRELELLHQVAATCEMKRFSNGGIKVNKRDVLPLLTADGEITLEDVDEESPARNLVSEMMVLANSAAANFASQNRVPLIYRTQEHPDPTSQRNLQKVPEGPALDYAIRVGLKKSLSSIYPGHHATLGLNAYCQATSPIRRYADLCNQRQLLSVIGGGPPMFSDESLLALLEKSEERAAKANLVSRETKRLWLLRYLKRRMVDNPLIEGTVVRSDARLTLVELDEVYIIASFKSKNQISLGERKRLRITGLNPEFDELKLEEVL